MTYLHRVRVVKYPEGSQELGWQPSNWQPGYIDDNGYPQEFDWPRRRQYISQSGAYERARLFREYGAEVVVERSNKITWPDE